VFSQEDVLHFLEEQVDTTTEFKLFVDREELPERGILQWKRKKAASPASVLKVVFLGETGIDTGALRKGFLTGKLFKYSTCLMLTSNKRNGYSVLKPGLVCLRYGFRVVGEIMAVSLAQGGPAPAFLREWCYNFLCTGEMNFSSLSKEDVVDLESSLVINRVSNIVTLSAGPHEICARRVPTTNPRIFRGI
ncbi:hypothetical protein LDENG_00294830, partial [Lucifuga dentata]